MTDDYLSWLDAIAALRLRAVVSLDVFPREDEPVPLWLLRCIGGAA